MNKSATYKHGLRKIIVCTSINKLSLIIVLTLILDNNISETIVLSMQCLIDACPLNYYYLVLSHDQTLHPNFQKKP